MTTSPQQDIVSVEELLKVLEPLMRRIVREELARLVAQKENSFFDLEPETPLYEDMVEILQRKQSNQTNFYSHQDIWNE